MNSPTVPPTPVPPTASDPQAVPPAPTDVPGALPPRTRRRGRTVLLLLAAVLPVMSAGILWSIHARRQATPQGLETYPVGYEHLDQSLVFRGEVESAGRPGRGRGARRRDRGA